MSNRYELRDLHSSRVMVELDICGRSMTVEGIAQYHRGELRVSVADPSGEFVLILNDSTWNGAISDAPDGNGFLIRVQQSASS